MPSIKEKLEKRKDLLVKYLELDGEIKDACHGTVFSVKEMGNIYASSDRNKVFLQTLIAKAERKGDGVLDGFVKVLEEIPGCEYLASFCRDDELDEELTTKLWTQDRWEEATEPYRPEIIKTIISEAQTKFFCVSVDGVCKHLSFFFDELEARGILEDDWYWRKGTLVLPVLEQANELINKVSRLLRLEPFVRFLLAEVNPELLLEIENRAASAPADLSLPLAKLPPELLRENTLKNFACLVDFFNADESIGPACLKQGVFSVLELKAIEADGPNRSRAYLKALLAKAGQDPGILERFAGVLRGTGRECLALIIEVGLVGELAEKLRMEMSYKPLINQDRSKLVAWLSYELQAERFFDGLKKEGIITIDGREEAELRKGGFFNQANWVINKARELFKTPELVDYLLGVLQKPEDKKFLSALKDSALQSSCSSVVVPDENEEDARLLQRVLKKINEALQEREKIIQERDTCLKAAEEKMARAETEGQEALEAARREKATVVEKFIEKIALADERVAESGDPIIGIDVEVWCDHCNGFPEFPRCFDEVWASNSIDLTRPPKLVRAVDVGSDEQIKALCDGLRNSRQMGVLRRRANRNPEQEKACQEEFEKLKNSWKYLTRCLPIDEEFLYMSESRKIISNSDRMVLKKFLADSLTTTERTKKFLHALENSIGNSEESSLDILKICCEKTHRLCAIHCLENGHTDGKATQLNKKCVGNTAWFQKTVRTKLISFDRWCRILDELVAARIVEKWAADQLKCEGREQSGYGRPWVLRERVFRGLDSYQIYKILRIIRKDDPELVERLTIDEIRKYQFNQYLVELALRIAAINPKLAVDDLDLIITKLVTRAFGRPPSAKERDQHRATCLKAKEKLSEFLESRAEVPKPDDSGLCDQYLVELAFTMAAINPKLAMDDLDLIITKLVPRAFGRPPSAEERDQHRTTCLKAKEELSAFLENRAEVPKPDDSELCDQSQSTDDEPMLTDGEPSETDGATSSYLSFSLSFRR